VERRGARPRPARSSLARAAGYRRACKEASGALPSAPPQVATAPGPDRQGDLATSTAVRGVDRPAPSARPPDIHGGDSGFRIPSETGDSEDNDPGYNLCGGGDSDQDGSMEVDFH
jgi:hypothetical protein